MKRIIPFLLALFLLTGCGGNAADGSYQKISQEEAKEMMDSQEVIILDVREQDEYDGGHIPGAVLLPVGTIDETTAAEVIPEKDSTVLVYCRSGNRSKTASSTLADLGYTNIFEFGGINTWPYETEEQVGQRPQAAQNMRRLNKEIVAGVYGRWHKSGRYARASGAPGSLGKLLGQCRLLWKTGIGHHQKAKCHHHVQPRQFPH